MTITPRRMDFPFDPTTVPIHWFGGNALATMKVNAINLIFPDGERYFIRSVRHYINHIDDPALKARARQFFAQEALHGREHGRANEMLEAQGFELDSWLLWYRRASGRIERLSPPVLRLSVTAALEHLTASLAHHTLTTATFSRAEPVMQDLMAWHAAEEIEHKSVAFDVFESVSGSWLIRAAGMVIALVTFLFFWNSAWRHIAKQDPALTKARIDRDLQEIRAQWQVQNTRRALVGYALAYFRPGFHPDDQDDYALAEAALERLEARYLASVG